MKDFNNEIVIIEEFLTRETYGKSGQFEARRFAAIKALYSNKRQSVRQKKRQVILSKLPAFYAKERPKGTHFREVGVKGMRHPAQYTEISSSLFIITSFLNLQS